MTWAVPESVDPKQAVTMPVGLQTAADALFNIFGFGLPAAGIDGRSAAGVPLLIWGGSSMVGLSTIQLAKLAGFDPIFTTASGRNHDVLRRLGATACFDYNSEAVVQEVREAVKRSGKKLTTVVDAVSAGLGVFEPSSERGPPDVALSTPSLAKQCCSEVKPGEDELRLSSVLPVAHDPDWKFCLGARAYGETGLFGDPQDPSYPERVENFMAWYVPHHGKSWETPNITVVHGVDETIRQMYRVFEGKVSMEKVVVAHPL